MTENKTTTDQENYLAVKFAIYEAAIAGLLRTSPHAAELHRDIQKFADAIGQEYGENSRLHRVATGTLKNLFGTVESR